MSAQGKLSAEEVRQATAGRLRAGDEAVRFPEVSTDSRTLQAGDLFLALEGRNFDGHQFVSEAFERGARGAVVRGGVWAGTPPKGGVVIEVSDTLRALGDLGRFWRGRHPVPVVAVTGSNGKTTTKEMIAAILGQVHRVLKSEGNLNNLVGLPLALLRLEPGHTAAVVELGTNAKGEIARLAEICQPTVGLITNIGAVHLEGLGSLQGVMEEKRALYRALPPHGVAVYNADDPGVVQAVSGVTSARLGFGVRLETDVTAEVVALTQETMQVILTLGQGQKVAVRLQVVGLHNVYNALAAAACALAVHTPPEAIRAGLEAFRPMAMRSQFVRLGHGITLLNDAYNANPASMEAALRTLGELRGGRRTIAVLGDMLELGEHAREAHRALGQKVRVMNVDLLFAVGAFAGVVGEAACALGMEAQRIVVGADCPAIWPALRQAVRDEDLILVKGSRGIRMEQVVEALLAEFGPGR